MKKRTADDMHRLNVEQYHDAEKIPLTVVLDNVRSQHNIGAVFRTADAFRVEQVVLCGICCCPPNTEIHKTALGAEESVSWSYYPSTMEALHVLREQGYTLLAVEQVHDSIALTDIAAHCPTDAGQHYALILGHEVFGVSQDVVDAADACIEIPQFGTKHSLNVSVAAGIAMYAFRQLLTTPQAHPLLTFRRMPSAD